jgi:hypothetical protein
MNVRWRRFCLASLVACVVAGMFVMRSWFTNSFDAQESFDEAVNLLTDEAGYYQVMHGTKLVGDFNIEEMLSNRRCVKILGDLGPMPPAEKEARCRQMFELLVAKHAQTLRNVLSHAEDPSAPENKQSMHATQISVCCAMVATAKYASTSALEWEFSKLDELRDEMEGRFEQANKAFKSSLMRVLRDCCAPDSRARLNILCLHAAVRGTTRTRDGVQKVCGDFRKPDGSPEIFYNSARTPRFLDSCPWIPWSTSFTNGQNESITRKTSSAGCLTNFERWSSRVAERKLQRLG